MPHTKYTIFAWDIQQKYNWDMRQCTIVWEDIYNIARKHNYNQFNTQSASSVSLISMDNHANLHPAICNSMHQFMAGTFPWHIKGWQESSLDCLSVHKSVQLSHVSLDVLCSSNVSSHCGNLLLVTIFALTKLFLNLFLEPNWNEFHCVHYLQGFFKSKVMMIIKMVWPLMVWPHTANLYPHSVPSPEP